MTKTYTVGTVTEVDGKIVTAEIGTFTDKTKAMNAAKRAAHTRKDCEVYGPTSLCYVGKDITAVVAW